MTVCYLEVDDEITSAIARIRAVTDGEAVIVVPPGSRIATSRINFKLLVREASERRLNVAAVSDEPSVRALAISAGLPAYDSLVAAEQALVTFREQDRKLAERLGLKPGETPPPRKVATEQTQVWTLPPDVTVTPAKGKGKSARSRPGSPPPEAGSAPSAATLAATAATPATADPTEPRDRDRDRSQRRIPIAPLLVAGLLVLLLAGVGYGAYLFLPTATITLQPLTTELRPAPFTVVADPNVAVSDPAAAVVPAQWVEIPLSVSNTFPATGVEARETRATGVVRFRSENTLNSVPVVQGTVVATTDGVEFETTEPASIPRADFATSTPGTVDVAVRAVHPGTRGNVAADTITELPATFRGQLVSARNPDPTDGGRRIEEPVVTQEDFDAALISLDAQLESALATALALPSTTPRGLTIFPITAQTGRPDPVPTATEVVGTAQPSFTVSFESMGTVLAVNEALVDELAEARLRVDLTPDQKLVGDAVDTTRSAGRVIGQTVTYNVAPVATAYVEPDRLALVAQLRGKSVADAQRILSAYGMVEVSMWPEFVDRLPDQTARISLIVVAPSPRP
jgi:hypothetical protein